MMVGDGRGGTLLGRSEREKRRGRDGGEEEVCSSTLGKKEGRTGEVEGR